MTDIKVNPYLRRQQVYVYHNIANGHTWSQSVFIPFKPRTCIVRQLAFCVNPERDTDVYLLRGISLDDSVLGMVPAVNINVESNVVIDLADKLVGPTLQFQLQNPDTGAITAVTGTVSCILEFTAG